MILNDSYAGDLIYASDHYTLNTVNASSLHGISRSSIEVFTGKLDAIDYFECVFDMQLSLVIISKSSMICWCLLVKGVSLQSALIQINYKKWHHENLGYTMMYYSGCCYQY